MLVQQLKQLRFPLFPVNYSLILRFIESASTTDAFRIKFDELPRDRLPRSSTAKFSEKWQSSVGDENFLDHVVERWRSAGAGPGDSSYNAAMFADAMHIGSPRSDASEHAEPAPRAAGGMRREIPSQPAQAAARSSTGGLMRRDTPPALAPQPMPASGGGMSLRERLLKPNAPR